MKSADIRTAFIQYFQSLGHETVASSSLVPASDPTLLFTNAGMVQFKETFLGLQPRSYQRAVSSQRCVRAGGKHNDLENVGYTARHHTFFEMLGNFSFGDYFKHDAIRFAWTFLTEILQLPPEKLWISVYKDDAEAAAIWLNEIGIPKERLSYCGDADNFWSMGDTGPCGPCTEIFYDHGPDIFGGPPGSADADGDRYIEIWNLVFMQYNRAKDGSLQPLPKPSVDTGMGLERISAVMQGVHNNYDIDIFKHLTNAIVHLGPKLDPKHPSVRVIADHIRACAFLIADGVLPSNEGRGYVLRRIIRRAIRHGNTLEIKSPFFARLVQPLAEIMGDAYPELRQKQAAIEEALLQEEERFSQTLEQGLKLLQEQIATLKTDSIPGEIAFKLYDTYGFPLDLIQDIAREKCLTVDVAAFDLLMQQQKALSQTKSQFAADETWHYQLDKSSTFHGYEKDTTTAQVTALYNDAKPIEKMTLDMEAVVVLDHSPFYAESGGQVGDRGIISTATATFTVHDTQKIGQAIAHYGKVTQGELQVGVSVEAAVDKNWRSAVQLNHTATHLLHAALKQILGSHIHQKGSLVHAERSRFDFSHPKPLTLEEITAVEILVNDKIRANLTAKTELMSLEAAKKSGAEALFDEKYAEEVRVLSLGDFSKELCGGTHAGRTGDIGLFKITNEYGVASGIRRLEFVTGKEALTWLNEQLSILDNVASQLKATRGNVSEKLAQTVTIVKQQEKELQSLEAQLAARESKQLVQEMQQVGEHQVLIKELKGASAQTLRTTLDQLKSSVEKAIIVLYSIADSKLQVIAGVSTALIGNVPTAAALVQQLCGKGGGRADMAQGGGPIPQDFEVRLEGLKDLLKS